MQSAEKNIRTLMAVKFFCGLVFSSAIMVPFYRDRLNLGFGAFMTAETIYTIMVIVGEVPNGWLSDVWGRKKTLTLGALLGTASYLILLLAGSLLEMCIGMGFMGLALSMISGTDTSLLYDTLLNTGREKEFVRFEGQCQSMAFYAVAMASLASGFIYTLDIRLPLALTILSYIVAFAFCLRIEEPERRKKIVEKNALKDMLITMRYAFSGKLDVFMIVVFSALFFSLIKAIIWAQQPYYMALNIDEAYFGVLFSIGYTLMGLSIHNAHRIPKWITIRTRLVLCWLFSIIAVTLSALSLGPHGILFLCLGGAPLYGLTAPHVKEAIHRSTGSEQRATVISTSNIMLEMAFVPVCISLGYVSDQYGILNGLVSILGWLVVAGVILLMWTRFNAKRLLPAWSAR